MSETNDLFLRYGITPLLNAWGTATPYGVSRSSPFVAATVATALQQYVDMAELQRTVGTRLARFTGFEAACVTHCTAAALTLAVAACLAGESPERIAALPDMGDRARKVIVQVPHRVNYGHDILQAVRLAGALPVLIGTAEGTREQDVQQALQDDEVVAILAVESNLVPAVPYVRTERLAEFARSRNVPLILDAAAQDLRLSSLSASGADVVLVSAQKYLAAPTAGLALGRSALVRAIDAQHGGIGRAMKPTKEAIFGVLAALEEREQLDFADWQAHQQQRVSHLLESLQGLPGVHASAYPDAGGSPVVRIKVNLDANARCSATELTGQLRRGQPTIVVDARSAARGELSLEVQGLLDDEVQQIGQAFRKLLNYDRNPPAID